MPIRTARNKLAILFRHRCVRLFFSLLALIISLPFLEHLERGPTIANVLQLFVLLAAVAAIGKNVRSFVVAICLAMPALAFHLVGIITGEEYYLTLSRVCSVLFYVLTIAHLLYYVFQPEVMDADKLFGAASVYLMLGVTWAYLYSLIVAANPEAFRGLETNGLVNIMIQLIYFSFTTLTTVGYGDITPATSLTRMLANMEQITGTLFVAILIARLAGVYPPQEKKQ
jgi:hypothetical protein